ncbi:ATPase, T2SS/T4P/T4SS family [Sinorhizobium sp. CCBAU 05631]|uniref:type IV pilus twitching motility protein PilT n=1 Tax=Sinorhizobium sp. CCBAU 05631 TaxID=794846 RepID=UPI0004BA8F61|nr:ATPase, T2SS/T4P/T4SS family [Sinorhizobium sp. CCBAU 05631]ASY61390.1 Twitching motility protein PilT [Sinorhizobium sp. CCBAU 05631]
MIDETLLDKSEFSTTAAFVPVLKEEPTRFDTSPDIFDTFIVGAAKRGASDITIQSEARPRIQINSRQHYGAKRILLRSEVDLLLSYIWRSSDAPSILRQGRCLDFSYEVQVSRQERHRFRVNATPITKNGGAGIELTLRSLPSKTPSLDDVQFEGELRPFLNPKSGIIVIAGATGHGKSTTMAAITRMHLENPENPRKIVDFQAPIEFTFADILSEQGDSPSFIGQTEIGEGRDLPTFATGIWSSLRRAPAIINVGEARDHGSMSGCIAASIQGHIVNTTTHAGSVAEGLRRMAMEFPPEEQASRAFDLISSLQIFIVQHLIRTTNGTRRYAVREFLVFDDDVRDRFLDKPIDAWSAVVRQLLKEGMESSKVIARPLALSVMKLVDDGRITADEARSFIPRSMFEILN